MNIVQANYNSEDNSVTICGDFQKDSILVNLPKNDPDHLEFTSMFLHRRDIMRSITYLQCISVDKADEVNEALFLAALAVIIKCFQKSESRIELSKEEFSKKFPHVSDEFQKFKNWRNKHYLHDENEMVQTTAILFVAPKQYDKTFGGAPTVIWNMPKIDYYKEGMALQNVALKIVDFIEGKANIIEQRIMERYSQKSRDELLNYESANCPKSTTAFPYRSR